MINHRNDYRGRKIAKLRTMNYSLTTFAFLFFQKTSLRAVQYSSTETRNPAFAPGSHQLGKWQSVYQTRVFQFHDWRRFSVVASINKHCARATKSGQFARLKHNLLQYISARDVNYRSLNAPCLPRVWFRASIVTARIALLKNPLACRIINPFCLLFASLYWGNILMAKYTRARAYSTSRKQLCSTVRLRGFRLCINNICGFSSCQQ